MRWVIVQIYGTSGEPVSSWAPRAVYPSAGPLAVVSLGALFRIVDCKSEQYLRWRGAVHVGGKLKTVWQADHECRHEYTNPCAPYLCIRGAIRGRQLLVPRAAILAPKLNYTLAGARRGGAWGLWLQPTIELARFGTWPAAPEERWRAGIPGLSSATAVRDGSSLRLDHRDLRAVAVTVRVVVGG